MSTWVAVAVRALTERGVTFLRYDGFDRLRCWIFPSPTSPGQLGGNCSTGDFESYTYDAVGNRLTLRKRDGTTIGFEYDNLNQMTRKTVPASASGAAGYTVHYRYDVRGLQTDARFGSLAGNGIANSYDAFGRLTSSRNTTGGSDRRKNAAFAAQVIARSGNDRQSIAQARDIIERQARHARNAGRRAVLDATGNGAPGKDVPAVPAAVPPPPPHAPSADDSGQARGAD